MFSHIHSANVVVSDQQSALEFYAEVLGWTLAMDMPMGENARWLTVKPSPSAQTELALAPAVWFTEETMPGKETGISLITPDIDHLYSTLTERGVKFKDAPAMMPWGQRAAKFFDLEGNEFFVVESRA